MKGVFWRFLQKEMRQAAPVVGVLAGAVLGWHLFLYTRLASWPKEAIVGLAIMPVGFVPFWLLWRSFATMRREWTGNHMYLLLALPVRGWTFAGAKVLVVLLEAASYVAVVAGGASVLAASSGFLTGVPWTDVRPSAGVLALVGAASLLMPLTWIVVIQFSYVAGRLVSK